MKKILTTILFVFIMLYPKPVHKAECWIDIYLPCIILWTPDGDIVMNGLGVNRKLELKRSEVIK